MSTEGRASPPHTKPGSKARVTIQDCICSVRPQGMCVFGGGGVGHLQVNKYRSEEEEEVSVETKREGRVSETTGSLQSPATL